jgi:hypothetical protein
MAAISEIVPRRTISGATVLERLCQEANDVTDRLYSRFFCIEFRPFVHRNLAALTLSHFGYVPHPIMMTEDERQGAAAQMLANHSQPAP